VRQANLTMTTRPIPVSGEALPVIGLGTWQTFDVGRDAAAHRHLAEVLRVLFAGGGKVIDSSPMYGRAEGVVGDLLTELNAHYSAFIATKVWATESENLAAQMESLQTLNPGELDQRWKILFRSDRPNRVCGRLLTQALAYRLQEKAIGGLKPSTRRMLEHSTQNASARGSAVELPKIRLKAGAVLIREWHGTTHRISVLEKGFLFSGKRYRSLSEIARTITGARWSGPLFFGLKSSAKEQHHGAE